MPEGKGGKSFSDTMLGILAELGKAEAFPDADPEMISSLRQTILPAVQSSIASQDPMAQLQAAMGGGDPAMAGMDPAAMGAPAGPPAPMPVEQAPTRLPRRRGNPQEQLAGIERDLSATVR